MSSLADKFLQKVNQTAANKDTDRTDRTEIMPGGVKSMRNLPQDSTDRTEVVPGGGVKPIRNPPPDSTDRTQLAVGGGGPKLPSSMQKNSQSEMPNRIRSSNFEQIKGHEFNSALSKENKDKSNKM